MSSNLSKKLDPILATSDIAKLVESIISHSISDPTNFHQVEEFKSLKEKYISSDSICSLTSSHGILSLIEEGVLGISACTEFISLIPSLKNYGGALETLSGLLILDLRIQLSNKKSYSCPFNLQTPQHPLISVLKVGRDSWLHVLNQMHYICYHCDETVQKYSLELLKPVFLYILCSPKLYNYSKRQTWSLLLKICIHNGWSKGMDILLSCISWIQTENDVTALLEFNCMLNELADAALQSNEVTLAATVGPYLASLSHQLLQNGLDPRMCISSLRKILLATQDTSSEIAILIAEAIGKCPSLYLRDYILLCSDIVKTKSCNALSAKMLLVSLLQWLAFPNILTTSCSISMQELASRLRNISNDEWKCSKNACLNAVTPTTLTFRAADAQRVDFAYIISEAGNIWKDKPEHLKEWLERLKCMASHELLVKLQLTLSAIFLEGTFGNMEAEVESCELLLRLVESNAELGRGVLTLLLYKLARESNPESQLRLLRSIPAMAMQKENVHLVLNTLESLRIKKSLKPVVLDLYVRLWKVEARCYPYLHKLMVNDPKDVDWEWELAKANVLKGICDLRAHAHGKDLLPLLSQTLNRCSPTYGKGKEMEVEHFYLNKKASAASALALAGTSVLLKEKIIDPCAVWNVLGPKLSRDRRSTVIKSLCKLFTVILSLKSPSVEYETLSTQLVSKLWSYIILKNDPVVKRAALESLSSVNLAQMPLKHVPEIFRQGIKLPSAYAKTPVDAARKPEDVLPYTPGTCWIQLIQKIELEIMDAVEKLLEVLIKRELVSQRGLRVPANVGVGREPESYVYLPEHSVVRTLHDCLRRTSNTFLDGTDLNQKNMLSIALTCLKILGQSYPKPFPPVDWSFLNVYSDIGPEYQNPCLCLAIRRANSSISCRKYVEFKFNSFTPSECPMDQIQFLYELLGDICKGIPPNVWRPIIEGCLFTLLGKTKKREGTEDDLDAFIIRLFSFIKSALLIEEIPDVNRSTIALIMENVLEKVEVEDLIFTSFVECVGELPTKYIERMSSPSVWWEVTSDKLKKGARIRCELASRSDSDNPLVWLNEIIEAASSLPGEFTFILKTITPTLTKCKDQNINCQWILQLMGQIMKMINENKSEKELQAPAFLIDVWILCIICMSGCDCLTPNIKKIAVSREQRIQLFPQALSTILQLPEWQSVSPQILEWQLHTSTSPCVPDYHRTVLYRGILSVHQNSHLLKKNAWMRFISSQLRGKRACEA